MQAPIECPLWRRRTALAGALQVRAPSPERHVDAAAPSWVEVVVPASGAPAAATSAKTPSTITSSAVAATNRADRQQAWERAAGDEIDSFAAGAGVEL